MTKMSELTTEEKALILRSIDNIFRSGISGDINTIEKTVNMARSIERKFNVVEVADTDLLIDER